MYDQNTVMFIHEFISRSISEISRITNLYIGDMTNDAENAKTRLVSVLRNNYGPFLGGYFSILEKIIEDSIKESMTMHPIKLHEVEKTLITQLRRLELDIQGGLSKSPNLDNFKAIMSTIDSDLISKLKIIEKDNSKEGTNIREPLFIVMQNKVDAYFVNIGLTSENICNEIKQTIDIYQNNLLDKIDEKIPALIYVGGESAKLLSGTVMTNLSTAPNMVAVNNIATPGPSMFKM